MGNKIVVALGGNALGNTVKEQLELASVAAKSIVDLMETGHDIIVTHGNGPQVGMISKAMNYAYEKNIIGTELPMAESSALSVGYIGFHLQNAIQNELRKRGMNKGVASVVTQVLVDKEDGGFRNPTKPIGAFVAKEEAQMLEKETGYKFVEDSGRGYRRVIASPKPVDIIELESIRNLSDHSVVIACGGGGIPVIEENGKLIGAEAVIDKDLTSALLARLIDADVFIILTAVEHVAINFNQPNMKKLEVITQKELKTYVGEGHFAAGSMLPKVLAAMDFTGSGKNKKAIITSLENSSRALRENAGTIIIS
ncbi:carbamate kinase [Proteiniclasticum sp. SCR006]|uniref:Carbamate kinase n=1 Tax=Proteiniclasticum aestuarii TaxID=2817862 RepID=A0A939KJQ6_9CLOT|nr:carbamate kinase [Proteiniclasticum aestuarii]MBO1265291.1 carbamate kinase [Proteiniclasticum aestuarii]